MSPAPARAHGRQVWLARASRRRMPGSTFKEPPMIKIGDRIPDATLTESTEFGEACPIAPKTSPSRKRPKGKRIVLFGLPGAYTPTCSAKHVPGYVEHLAGAEGEEGRRSVVRLAQRRLRHGRLGARPEGHRQGPHARRRQRRAHAEARPRGRPEQGGPRPFACSASRCSSTTAS